LLVMSVILPFFTKPGCSVPSSQKPSNGTFPEPDESNPRLRILLLNIHFNIILPFTPSSSKRSLSSSLSNRNPVCIFILHMRATDTIQHILHTSSNNSLSVCQFAHASHNPVLRHAHYMDISLQSEIKFHTRYRSNYGSTLFILYIHR